MKLLVVERMVLESINLDSKSLDQLNVDTRLGKKLIKKVLISLIEKGIVEESNNTFSLNKGKLKEISEKKDGLSSELQSLFSNLIKGHLEGEQESLLFMEKYWMTESEEIVFNSLIDKLKSFLKDVKQSRNITPNKYLNEKLYQKKVLLFGQSSYHNIINNSLCLT